MSAKTRLDVIIDSARQRQQFTHFLSIPVTCEEVVVGFEDFRFKVLNECDGVGIFFIKKNYNILTIYFRKIF